MDAKLRKKIDLYAKALLVIGGVNWGLVGLLGIDIVDKLLGNTEVIAKAVYVLVGVSAVYLARPLLFKKK